MRSCGPRHSKSAATVPARSGCKGPWLAGRGFRFAASLWLAGLWANCSGGTYELGRLPDGGRGSQSSTGGAQTDGASGDGRGGTGGTSAATGIGGGSAATGRFYVVGRDIVGPDGNLFFPYGGNLAASIKRANGQVDRSYTFDFGGTANGHSDDALAWGWNAVRINFVCYRPDAYTDAEDLERSLAAIVDEYTAKKIVVIAECHDDWGKMLALTSPELQAAEAFWDLAISAHKDNPYVWLNPYNEQTVNQDTAGQHDYWTQMGRHFVAKRNAAGAENVLVMGFPEGGQGASTVAESDVGSGLTRDQCNLVLSWHAFAGNGSDTAQYDTWYQEILARQIALMIGAYGFTVDGSVAYHTSNSNLVTATDLVHSLGKKYGVGAIAWHGTGDANDTLVFALTSGYQSAATAGFWNASKGQGLSELGKKVWDAGHTKPALGTYAGSLAASHCPSAR